jgi:hypothetical protein
MDIKFNFENPLLVSQRNIDQIDCKVINPFLFISQESGNFLTDSSEIMKTSMPKQMPAGFSAETVQKAAEVVE